LTLPSQTWNALRGVTAALLCPRKPDGSFNEAGFAANLQAVLDAGTACVSVGGATGEYPLQTIEERETVLRLAGELVLRAGRAFLPAVGAISLDDSVRLAKTAADAGACAVLLPPPHFYRYAQADLTAFYETAISRIPLPVLLYNLPCFLSPLEPSTVLQLVEAGAAGLKDSGSDLLNLQALTAMRGLPAVRLVGNDALLRQALSRSLCDGCVSGVAGVLPELLLAVFDPDRRTNALFLLDEVLALCDPLPTPWALKVMAGLRGWSEPWLPFPPSETTQLQIKRLSQFYRDNQEILTQPVQILKP
jgi:dihydrodipicolinate synthase/N-acetylneuraminate lyase